MVSRRSPSSLVNFRLLPFAVLGAIASLLMISRYGFARGTSFVDDSFVLLNSSSLFSTSKSADRLRLRDGGVNFAVSLFEPFIAFDAVA